MKSNRYHSLDFWRGVACLMIVFVHSSLYVTLDPKANYHGVLLRGIYAVICKMWIAVPIFFVISGYCITAACDKLRDRPFAVKQFFLRRFLRIFPPYWIALAISLIAALAIWFAGFHGIYNDAHPTRNPLELSLSRWIGNLSLTETWSWRVAGFTDGRKLFLGQAWSLCYEEQFYAICGLTLFIAPRRFFHLLLGITLVIACLAAGPVQARLPWTEGVFLDGRWITFALGVLVYFRLNYAAARSARAIDALMFAAAIAALIECVRTPMFHGIYSTVFEEQIVGLFFSIVIILLYRWDKALADSRWLRPVAFCGTMCYSLYLVHWPLVSFVSYALDRAGVRGPSSTLLITIPLCMAISVSLAWVFHLKIERRFFNPALAAPPKKEMTSQFIPTTIASQVANTR